MTSPGWPLAERSMLRAGVAAGLVAFYLLTAPHNHSTALDSYGFAYWISEYSVTEVPELRLFLWIVAMQGVYSAASWLAADPDPFALFAVVNAIQTAAATVLLERLLASRFALSASAAWLTALGFSVSYGVWRYATELEIYASAALISVALLHATFSIERESRPAPSMKLIGLAFCGGLATLCYQPLGIVAGLAMPIYLIARLPLVQVAWYFAVCGVVVALGLALAFVLASADPDALTVQSVLDTDGKPLLIPTVGDIAQAAVAFLQNFLSINWSFAFEPTRAIFEQYAGRSYRVFLFPAQFAGPGYLLFLLTLPAAGALVVAALAISRRSPERRPPSAAEIAVLAWLAGHAAMVLLIDPGGLEAWIPSLVPVFIVFGLRVAEPLAAQGHAPLGVALVAVFLLHNWFAGIGIFRSPDHNYNDERADPIIAVTGTDDLLVVGSDWAFDRFLSYEADAANILVSAVGAEATRALIERTFARGGRVFLFDDVIVPEGNRVRNPAGVQADLEEIAARYSDGARRIPLGEAGHAFEIYPEDGS